MLFIVMAQAMLRDFKILRIVNEVTDPENEICYKVFVEEDNNSWWEALVPHNKRVDEDRLLRFKVRVWEHNWKGVEVENMTCRKVQEAEIDQAIYDKRYFQGQLEILEKIREQIVASEDDWPLIRRISQNEKITVRICQVQRELENTVKLLLQLHTNLADEDHEPRVLG